MGEKKFDLDQRFESLMFDIKYDKKQLGDSWTLGLLMYRLAKEREQSNQLMQDINQKLDILLTNNTTLSTTLQSPQAILPPVDNEILGLVKANKSVDAEQVQKHFKYKGKNAASARLNALEQKGFLKKLRVGRKVFFTL